MNIWKVEERVNNMDKFFSFPETGQLTIEKILFDAGYPILFTCRSDGGKLYLCVCCQYNELGKKWLLAETVPDVVVKMLRNKVTIRDAFLMAEGKRFTIIQKDGLSIKENVLEDWDAEKSIFLPDAGEYMEAESGEYDEEILFYEQMIVEHIVIHEDMMIRIELKQCNSDCKKRMESYLESFSKMEINIRLNQDVNNKNYRNNSVFLYAA